MRNFERQADIYAYATIGSPLPLISTFEKISLSSGQSPDKPNWHHFSIQERISYLAKCASDRSWIDRHNLKIKKSIAAYIIAIAVLGWIGFDFHYGRTGETINSKLLKKIILTKIDHEPKNSDLYQILGDIYYSENDYPTAVNAYLLSLKYTPNHIQSLNNLAWLYATCEDERYRSPKKALEFAQVAASLSKEAYVLDTLAEAYYVNGYFNEAVETEKLAISAAKTNLTDYLHQLTKFKNALSSNKTP